MPASDAKSSWWVTAPGAKQTFSALDIAQIAYFIIREFGISQPNLSV
jgi:hypothetical protein